jgi:hypothetical protein
LALFDWRITPSEQLKLSPAQIVYGRRLISRLPIADSLLQTTDTIAAREALATAKVRQAKYYNLGAKDRLPLAVGQTGRVKVDDNSECRKGEIAKQLPYRSYEVNFDDASTHCQTRAFFGRAADNYECRSAVRRKHR